ncbi:MAG TPA: efflux RND transporter periplasmic adaptor subunit [Gemmataceae bacterium]|nr:efflux RND transporter periplasmic adaptor subunit [Gemmataceae bacterium]
MPAAIGRRLAFGALLVAFVAACDRQAASPPAPPPPKVTVAKPVSYPVQGYYEYNGHLEAVEAVEIRARVKGILEQIHFVEGDEVEAGAPLYTIDPREYRTAVARATADQAKSAADIMNWKAQIKLAEAELQRLMRSPAAAVTQSEIDKARATVDVNAAQLAVAQAAKDAAAAALQTSNIQLGYTDIRAPIAGRISRTLITKGNLVGQDQPTLLTTIVSMDPIYVYFDAPEKDLLKYQQTRRVKGGQEAAVEVGVTVESGYPHHGTIDFQENRVDVGTGTVRLRGRLSNPAAGPRNTRLLYPGLYARVRVPAGAPEPRPVIPEDAIMTGQEGRFVYVLGPGDVVEKRVVTLGTRIWQAPPPGEPAPPGWALININPPLPAGDGAPPAPLRVPARSVVAIDRGLTPDDRVIVVGLQKARPGTPVAPDNWELRAPGKADVVTK